MTAELRGSKLALRAMVSALHPYPIQLAKEDKPPPEVNRLSCKF